jgi:hypothetical protein
MPPIFADGTVIVYRLYDVAYAIDLEHAARLLAPAGPERPRPRRTEAQALQIKNPPVSALLATHALRIANYECTARVSVRVFDFGVCALQAELVAPAVLAWPAYCDFAAGVAATPAIAALLEQELAELRTRLAPAAERPVTWQINEQYMVYRVSALRGEQGQTLAPESLDEDALASLLLREPRVLSADARRKLLPHRFSYYRDDLTVITWDGALVVEPEPHDRDVEYVLEFANAQLLQLRVYDEMLDNRLPAMYDDVAAVRRRRSPLLSRKYRPVLARLQTLVADVTETVEHSDNAFKITDDVYLADIYEAALRVFRSGLWRSAIERKLAIVRDTYGMLDAEAQSERLELLELAIVVIIFVEFVRSLF